MAFFLAGALFAGGTPTTVKAAVNQPTDTDGYNTWYADQWSGKAEYNTGAIVMAPGATESQMNFSWYSETAGSPAVRISASADMSGSTVFKGSASTISRTNGTNTYTASNRVQVSDLKASTQYYYQYTTDGTNWSTAAAFHTQSADNLTVICVGDPQIGASSGAS